MARFIVSITGCDYSTYEPAWKTMHVFSEGNIIEAEWGRKRTFREAIEKAFPGWKVVAVHTDKDCGMAHADLMPADGSKVKERCDGFFCSLLEVW